MPIDLTQHTKIWIHPQGIIPNKIIDRLILQREVRPEDTLSLFVNHCCLEGSANKIEKLNSKGIDIIVIEDALAKSDKDDPELIKWVNIVLEKGQKSKQIIDSVYASDLLRMMYVVQDKGLYSDTDVFFLPSYHKSIDNISYLFGTHHEGGMGADINVFGVDSYLMPKFYDALTKNLKAHKKAMLGENKEITIDNVDDIRQLPSILYIPQDAFSNEHEHTLLNFSQTQHDVIYEIEDHSWCEPELEAVLHDDSIPDLLLAEVNKRLLYEKNSKRKLRCNIF